MKKIIISVIVITILISVSCVSYAYFDYPSKILSYNSISSVLAIDAERIASGLEFDNYLIMKRADNGNLYLLTARYQIKFYEYLSGYMRAEVFGGDTIKRYSANPTAPGFTYEGTMNFDISESLYQDSYVASNLDVYYKEIGSSDYDVLVSVQNDFSMFAGSDASGGFVGWSIFTGTESIVDGVEDTNTWLETISSNIYSTLTKINSLDTWLKQNLIEGFISAVIFDTDEFNYAVGEFQDLWIAKGGAANEIENLLGIIGDGIENLDKTDVPQMIFPEVKLPFLSSQVLIAETTYVFDEYKEEPYKTLHDVFMVFSSAILIGAVILLAHNTIQSILEK